MLKKILLALVLVFNSNVALAEFTAFDEFINIYKKYGNEQYMIQEEITQKDHVLQAAYIAKQAGAPENVIVGLLMHDVGQVCREEYVGNVEFLHPHHDELGAKWVKDKGFPNTVSDLVRYHALAKVILCEEDPEYFEHLSEASKISYKYQKAKYDKPEHKAVVQTLKKHPRLNDFKSARLCDEMAKIIGFEEIPSFEAYREMIERVKSGKGKPESDPKWQEKVKALHTDMKKDRIEFEKKMIARG